LNDPYHETFHAFSFGTKGLAKLSTFLFVLCASRNQSTKMKLLLKNRREQTNVSQKMVCDTHDEPHQNLEPQ
jgi:hypothetical protein